MSETIANKLASLGFTLPKTSTPAANYVSAVREGNLLSVSGQISHIEGIASVTGSLGGTLDVEDGQKAAQIAALNVLAQIANACGGELSAVKRIVRLGVFIACDPSFSQFPQVANGASDLMVEVFGDAGRHSRAAVGVAALPRGVAVEVDALIALR